LPVETHWGENLYTGSGPRETWNRARVFPRSGPTTTNCMHYYIYVMFKEKNSFTSEMTVPPYKPTCTITIHKNRDNIFQIMHQVNDWWAKNYTAFQEVILWVKKDNLFQNIVICHRGFFFIPKK
jgi:hypothetical protein